MRFLGKKLMFYAVALLAALSLNFLIPRLAPGNPVDAVLARQSSMAPVSPEARHSLELLLGVNDQPLWQQYLRYLGQILSGDLGRSVTFFPAPVGDIIGQALPWTLGLVGVATVVSFTLGISLGALAGWFRRGIVDSLVAGSTMLAAIPYFWLALAALYFLSAGLGWFPLGLGYDVEIEPGWSGEFVGNVVFHALLPALTIVVSSLAGWLLGMRNMMVSTMGEDYVVTAQAKGLSLRRVMVTYAARNAVLPSVSGVAVSLGFVVGGAIVTEAVFSYPGIGFTLLQAVRNSDYPLMQGIFLIITLAVLGANLLVDLLYAVIDPRVRTTAKAGAR
ncbi:ABC transporter permease [Amycolatopsis sp. NPDC048633]|uniref:ABC transporter permease n=1 Tax=Amycolatopsis sp. NPDC048633 TaxID=3157095 RepID=UPI0033FD0016